MSEFFQMPAKQSPYLRVNLNVGCLMDIPTGSPVKAINGQYLTNGGHNGSIIFVGPGNSYKSALADYVNQVAAFRAHHLSPGQKYDTENNTYIPGLELRLRRIVKPNEPDWFEGENPRWLVTEASLYKGDEWFKMAKDWMLSKKKQGASFKVDTPLINKNGKAIKILLPTFVSIDSISMFIVEAVQELYDKTDLGDAKQNMVAMNSGRFKKNMIDQLPDLLVGTNTYFTGTVHYGQAFQLDPYAPQHKPSQYSETGKKLKGVPENIMFLSTCMWLIKNVNKLHFKTDKNVQKYPLRDAGEDNNPDDLNIVTMQQWRCKTGPSGYHLEIIVSQKYGILENLTHFHFLRQHGMYGLTGEITGTDNFKDVSCVLLPEVKLSRTTVRSLLDENHRLSRAISICADMLQMSQYWAEHLRAIDKRLLELTPATLYEKVKQNGYSWDMILDTRYWYSLDDTAHEQLELSTLDIMRMALGTYHPFWLESDKKTIKKKYAKQMVNASETNSLIEDNSAKAKREKAQ